MLSAPAHEAGSPTPLALDRILFPTDFSASAEGAYRHAAWLADRFGAELHVLHVVGDEPAPHWPDLAGTGRVQISLADVHEDLGLPAPPPAGGTDLDDPVEVIETGIVGQGLGGHPRLRARRGDRPGRDGDAGPARLAARRARQRGRGRRASGDVPRPVRPLWLVVAGLA